MCKEACRWPGLPGEKANSERVVKGSGGLIAPETCFRHPGLLRSHHHQSTTVTFTLTPFVSSFGEGRKKSCAN
jgi:hypothetical protein